ncbi:MAG TPA: dihydroneopterin aldolase [Xanthobacteraceae bacterium]|nr:dihydroneopterin aldolase [Xanthobacteraceae bacterium]
MTSSGNGLTVIKVGGSCVGALDLRRWTAAVAACAGRVVIVPGGGAFADAVRAAQRTMGFDDAAAHHMALLAMEQLGHALASFDARLSPADSVAELRRRLRDNKVPVWLPTRMTLAAADVPASWDVTSDSLAAWLAGRLGARRLVLMKQIDVPGDSSDNLASQGIVDRAFPRFLAASGVPALILGPADHMAVAATLCDDPQIGTRIVAR